MIAIERSIQHIKVHNQNLLKRWISHNLFSDHRAAAILSYAPARIPALVAKGAHINTIKI